MILSLQVVYVHMNVEKLTTKHLFQAFTHFGLLNLIFSFKTWFILSDLEWWLTLVFYYIRVILIFASSVFVHLNFNISIVG
jgi:hypothetical protein